MLYFLELCLTSANYLGQSVFGRKRFYSGVVQQLFSFIFEQCSGFQWFFQACIFWEKIVKIRLEF